MPIIAFQSKLKTCLDFKQVFGTRQHHALTLMSAIDHYYNEQKHAQQCGAHVKRQQFSQLLQLEKPRAQGL